LALASNGLSGRSTNSIGYATNSMNGFTANLGVSQEKTSKGNTGLNKVDGLIGSVAYNNGPISARYAFGQGKASIKSTASNLTSSKTTDNAFAVSYDLGVAKPYVQHETTKLTLQNIGGEPVDGGILKTSATEFGASFPMGAFAPHVTFGSGEVSLDGEEVKTSAFQVGTTYSLSKRTSIYAATGQFKIKGEQKTTGYKAGLIHNF
jgi:predicted porin